MREATTLGCFTTWAQLCQQLRAAFLLANNEYRQRSRFFHVNMIYAGDGKCHPSAFDGKNPLPEHTKVSLFMDVLKVGPSRTQLFRVHANTMEEAIHIALQEEYSHRQDRTPTSVWQGHNASTGAVQGAPAAGASTGPVPMELGTAVQSSIRCYGCGKLGHMQRACPAGGQWKFPSKPRGLRGPSWYTQVYGDMEILSESRLILGRRRTLLDARRSRGMATNLAVKFEAFLRVGRLRAETSSSDILSMPWLEKHEPWIDWRGKAIGASWSAVSDRALVSNVPTTVRDWGAGDGRQGAYAPEKVLGVTDSNEDVAVSLATGRETKAHCQACGIATTASLIGCCNGGQSWP
ncbi:LOW QUALITY PROTEIN: Gag protein [Phytophthora palmivora]|uniref:Gag protein n=1 Tax=Phytophthora palmivora TaxID=4796 RepID=A0A2P4YRE8_9STRA|nr:LOW QUALITY PROTEIN: Gag protein [Phytophthora palmivora]